MTDEHPLEVARAYHDARTAGDFTAAANLLSADVAIDVPRMSDHVG